MIDCVGRCKVWSFGDFGKAFRFSLYRRMGISCLKARLQSQACYDLFQLVMMNPFHEDVKLDLLRTTIAQTPHKRTVQGTTITGREKQGEPASVHHGPIPLPALRRRASQPSPLPLLPSPVGSVLSSLVLAMRMPHRELRQLLAYIASCGGRRKWDIPQIV